MMRSERLIVESLWAMEIVVLWPLSKAARAELTRVSDSASRADVASSRIKISGFLSNALAIAIRCFCPPDNWAPRAPTEVSRPSGKSLMNWQFAFRAAAMISEREACGLP